MLKCARIKEDGTRCKADAQPGATWCWNHDPAHAAERQRNARKGGKTAGNGRAGANGEIQEIKSMLNELISAVLAEKYTTGMVAVAGQLINIRLRAVELERKLRETQELEERIEALEAATTALDTTRQGKRRA